MVQRKARRQSALFYEDSAAHLADELRKLDLADPAVRPGVAPAASGPTGHGSRQRGVHLA
jgi:hypothetical protein